ncbi:MAG: hypothetical protein AAGG51_16800, partial [Cyanobacteria bacterium P01_G01_bin.54]
LTKGVGVAGGISLASFTWCKSINIVYFQSKSGLSKHRKRKLIRVAGKMPALRDIEPRSP